MNIEQFRTEVASLGVKLTDQHLSDLDKYKQLLQEYNAKFNLTTITKDEDIYLKHFYDSLTIIKATSLDNKTALDVGTGAGFPGIVLKIVFPSLKVTLVESNTKKATFLNTVINELNLKDIEVINARAEELPDKYREYFDIVTSRAVANFYILSELTIPYVKVGGLFIALKSQYEDELNISSNLVSNLGGKLLTVINFNLPIENSIRNIIIIQKITKTNFIYPRSYSKIKKEYTKIIKS